MKERVELEDVACTMISLKMSHACRYGTFRPGTTGPALLARSPWWDILTLSDVLRCVHVPVCSCLCVCFFSL